MTTTEPTTNATGPLPGSAFDEHRPPAQELVDAAAEDSKQLAEEVDTKETEELKAALGAQNGGRMPRGTAGVMKDLEDMQKRRRTRSQRDSLDLALTELTGVYRDVHNGVYRCGFARDQGAYEQAYRALFDRLDALAEDGILFTQAHATAPLCSPERGS